MSDVKVTTILVFMGILGMLAVGFTPKRFRMAPVLLMSTLGLPFIFGFISTLTSYIWLYRVRFPLAIWASPLIGGIAMRLSVGEWHAWGFLGGILGYCTFLVFGSPYEFNWKLRRFTSAR